MANEENPRAELERLETYRFMAIGVGLALTLVAMWLDTELLDIPRALAWGAGAFFCWRQGRILRRMGESPYSTYALAVCMVLIGLVALV